MEWNLKSTTKCKINAREARRLKIMYRLHHETYENLNQDMSLLSVFMNAKIVLDVNTKVNVLKQKVISNCM